MTRVNLIPVEELSDQHLLSETREIKRIPNCIIKGRFSLKSIPKNYTMGTGHVKYFYDKLIWLYHRYMDLYNECLKRGFEVTNYEDAFIQAGYENKDLCNNWIPTEQDIRVSRTRIAEKIFRKDVCQQKKYYRWTR